MGAPGCGGWTVGLIGAVGIEALGLIVLPTFGLAKPIGAELGTCFIGVVGPTGFGAWLSGLMPSGFLIDLTEADFSICGFFLMVEVSVIIFL